jgi:hypothetical protein
MLTTPDDTRDQTDTAPNWAADAPRGGRTVMNRILKENATVPLFFAQTLITSLRGVHARHALGAIQRNVSDCDWQLLTAAAMGTDYGEIARTTPARPGALRVKVLRLRRELTALIV